jgi:hypothetical protein
MIIVYQKIYLYDSMKIKDKIKTVLREHYGEFDSYLENKYETRLTETLICGKLEDKRAWMTYNQVMLELKYSLNDQLKVKELQYKLTEDVNPNEVCIEVIGNIKDLTPELERLYFKILNF